MAQANDFDELHPRRDNGEFDFKHHDAPRGALSLDALDEFHLPDDTMLLDNVADDFDPEDLPDAVMDLSDLDDEDLADLIADSDSWDADRDDEDFEPELTGPSFHAKGSDRTAEIYADVTNRVLEQLEQGTMPWRRPWRTMGAPTSMSTGKSYRGINTVLLAISSMARDYKSPHWGTYKQISAQGGQVRKGEKATKVTFWKSYTKKPTKEELAKDPNAKPQKRLILREFSVFNADQADDLPDKFYDTRSSEEDAPPIAEAEAVAEGYLQSDNAPKLNYGGDRAYYRPKSDSMQLPDRDQFASSEGYYGTLFHEMAHSTGAESRLNRPGIINFNHFGGEEYAREELVAELSAAMSSSRIGLNSGEPDPQHAAYIKSWQRAIKADPKCMIHAAAQAQRATDLIFNDQPNYD